MKILNFWRKIFILFGSLYTILVIIDFMDLIGANRFTDAQGSLYFGMMVMFFVAAIILTVVKKAIKEIEKNH